MKNVQQNVQKKVTDLVEINVDVVNEIVVVDKNENIIKVCWNKDLFERKIGFCFLILDQDDDDDDESNDEEEQLAKKTKGTTDD